MSGSHAARRHGSTCGRLAMSRSPQSVHPSWRHQAPTSRTTPISCLMRDGHRAHLAATSWLRVRSAFWPASPASGETSRRSATRTLQPAPARRPSGSARPCGWKIWCSTSATSSTWTRRCRFAASRGPRAPRRAFLAPVPDSDVRTRSRVDRRVSECMGFSGRCCRSPVRPTHGSSTQGSWGSWRALRPAPRNSRAIFGCSRPSARSRSRSSASQVDSSADGVQAQPDAIQSRIRIARALRCCRLEPNANQTHSVQLLPERTLDDSTNRRLVIPETFLATRRDSDFAHARNVAPGITGPSGPHSAPAPGTRFRSWRPRRSSSRRCARAGTGKQCSTRSIRQAQYRSAGASGGMEN